MTDDSHFAGTPVFADARAAALMRSQGPAAAWPAVLAAGPAAIADVGGDFAVGHHDAASGRTVLAVDRFATRTLCWRLDAGRLRFAERADALGDAATPLDPQALFDYLYGHVIAAPRTVFAGVMRLPAGHCAVHENGRLTVAPYWTPRFAAPPRPDFAALRDEFRDLLHDAVRRQLDDAKPACFLSGGTDSSTVAGIIGEVAGRPAATYSIGFDAEGYDEMAYARIAARHFGTEHHEYYITPADLVDGIPAVAASYDQPFGNSSVLPTFYCARRAREDGVAKLLAGDGGDELFGGNSRYAKQRVFGWYAQLPPALRRRALEPLFALPAVARAPLLRKGASYVEQARVPMPDRLQIYNLLLRVGVADVLTPRFLARIDAGAPLAQQREVWQQAQAAHEIDRTLAYDWRYTLAENDLPKVTGAARLAGIGVGFPLLDRALLDFSLRLPPAYKLNRLQLRWFFKEALRGFLPDAIITKKKHGFGLPFGVWLGRHAPLQRLALDSVSGLAERGIVRAGFVDDLVRTLLPAHPGYYGEMVWILMMLEQWLRAHRPNYSA
jgi:asparagine synthase (glutamine-hydrolysing)